jgi:hypothetical protein
MAGGYLASGLDQLQWRVPFGDLAQWAPKIEVAKMAVLQTAREHALTCTATVEKGRFGTHSAYAVPDGLAVAGAAQ